MKKITEQEIDSILFNALKQEPAGHLPPAFAEKVSEKIKAQQTLRLGLIYCLIAAVTAIIITVIFVWGLKLIRFSGYAAIVQPLLQHKWAGLLLLLTFLAGKFIDLKLTVKKLTYVKYDPASI